VFIRFVISQCTTTHTKSKQEQAASVTVVKSGKYVFKAKGFNTKSRRNVPEKAKNNSRFVFKEGESIRVNMA